MFCTKQHESLWKSFYLRVIVVVGALELLTIQGIKPLMVMSFHNWYILHRDMTNLHAFHPFVSFSLEISLSFSLFFLYPSHSYSLGLVGFSRSLSPPFSIMKFHSFSSSIYLSCILHITMKIFPFST